MGFSDSSDDKAIILRCARTGKPYLRATVSRTRSATDIPCFLDASRKQRYSDSEKPTRMNFFQPIFGAFSETDWLR